MKKVHKNRGPLPNKPPFDLLNSMVDPCFVVSEDLRIMYCNPAWDRFAQENGGGPEVLAGCVTGKSLLDSISGDLKFFYANLFAQVRAHGQPLDLDYECSSPSVFRLHHMQVFPLEPGQGFVIINSQRVERPHAEPAHQPDDSVYKDHAGLIHMCANCRRTRRLAISKPEVWDWVPAHLTAINVSHGVCPTCLDYYYSPFLDGTEQSRGQAA